LNEKVVAAIAGT